MKLEEYRKQLEGDEDYQAAAEELKPILDLADEILRLRLERGWSQSELARRTGTKQANISRIEAGLGNPTFKFIQKLAKAFECDLTVRFEKPRSPSQFLPGAQRGKGLDSLARPPQYETSRRPHAARQVAEGSEGVGQSSSGIGDPAGKEG